ncbi:MAG: fimbrillin family protein [Odoribacter sp.]|nr:fimbrillin family protein [Odoribacter sp.]
MTTRTILSTILAGSLFLTSCQQEEKSIDNTDELTLRLQSEITVSRAAETYWNAGDEIGVFMSKAGNVDIVNDIENKKYITAYGDGKFSAAEGEDLYPANGSLVDVIAYYPYQELITDMKYSVDIQNQEKQESIDFLYSNNLKSISKTPEVQTMYFDHMLSKLILSINPGNDLEVTDLEGMKVSIHGVYTDGTFDLTDGTFEVTPITNQVFFKTTESGRSSEMILIPGNYKEVSLEFELNTGLILTCTFPSDLSFKSSYKYTYSVTITPTLIEFNGEGIINPWNTENGGDLEANEPGAEKAKYSIGDYYPNAENPIGVVFWLDSEEDGKSATGKIVSLQQGIGMWGKTWGTYPDMYTEADLGVIGINSTEDGEEGTRNLISMRYTDEEFAEKYKAFAWIYNLNENNLEGRWYMPAKEELQVLKDWYEGNKEVCNNLLTTVGGTGISKGNYWTSTETAYDKAHYMQFESTNSMSAMKNIISIRVRAISKF